MCLLSLNMVLLKENQQTLYTSDWEKLNSLTLGPLAREVISSDYFSQLSNTTSLYMSRIYALYQLENPSGLTVRRQTDLPDYSTVLHQLKYSSQDIQLVCLLNSCEYELLPMVFLMLWIVTFSKGRLPKYNFSNSVWMYS